MNFETTVAVDDVALNGAGPLGGRRRWPIVLAVALVLAAIVGAVVLFSGGSSDTGDTQEQAPAVSVVEPGKASIQGEVQATGSLAARREMPVGVVGEGGRVVSVLVDAGQWVHAGQVLAVIDRSVQNQQAAGSAAQIDVAKADAELAQANLDRALQLVDRGFISKADVDRLTATRDAAVARKKVAEASYKELLARNARLNIVAPAEGLLLSRNVEPGQVVSPGSGALFSIAKGGEFELLAQVGEVELSRLSVGVIATVTPVGTDKTYQGQVWQLAPVIDQQTRQGTARIALPYAPGLRPGGFATAEISSGTVVAPMLPESAILNDDQGSYVYIVGKDNKVERRPVKTGLVTDNGIAVTSGLDGTEKVVLRAGGFLSPGEEIRPKLVKNPG